MRFLYLNHNVAYSGGTFFRAFHCARHLVRRGHSVTLLTISPDRRWGIECRVSEGVEIVHTPDLLWGIGRTGWDPWNTLNRINYLRGRRWDVIHAWDCRPTVILPALYARYLSRRCGGRLVIDWADWWGRGGTQAERPDRLARWFYGPVETFFEEVFRTKADGTTVASWRLRDRALRLGVPAESVLLLPGGSDIEIVQPMECQGARRRLGIAAGGWVVGFMGSLAMKDADLLFDGLLCAQRQLPNLRFLAIGAVIAGSGLGLRQVADKRWKHWMTETGRISYTQVGSYLAACDALLLPMQANVANMARWPSKVNDYLAAGRPIVATRVGEMVRLFESGAGVVTDVTAEAFAEGMVVLAKDRERARRFGQQARELAQGALNWARLVEGLEAFYDQVHDDGNAYSADSRQRFGL